MYLIFKLPKPNLLKKKIEYNTDKITPVIDIKVTKIFLSINPTNITSSPIKLQVPGNPVLAKQRINNCVENNGIELTNPP